MKLLDKKSMYFNQILNFAQENGLDQNCETEVKNCSDIKQVFQVLSIKGASHVAVLSSSSEPIGNTFSYIKEQLALNGTVALALFYDGCESRLAHS